MREIHDKQRGLQILERILISKKATREKKMLALFGLVSLASRQERRGEW